MYPMTDNFQSHTFKSMQPLKVCIALLHKLNDAIFSQFNTMLPMIMEDVANDQGWLWFKTFLKWRYSVTIAFMICCIIKEGSSKPI